MGERKKRERERKERERERKKRERNLPPVMVWTGRRVCNFTNLGDKKRRRRNLLRFFFAPALFYIAPFSLVVDFEEKWIRFQEKILVRI